MNSAPTLSDLYSAAEEKADRSREAAQRALQRAGREPGALATAHALLAVSHEIAALRSLLAPLVIVATQATDLQED